MTHKIFLSIALLTLVAAFYLSNQKLATVKTTNREQPDDTPHRHSKNSHSTGSNLPKQQDSSKETVKATETVNKARPELGDEVYRYHGVAVYSNGSEVYKSHGKHYASDGYYYGRKWQCVEFVKRYYHDAMQYRMPNVWGHAKSFFNPELPQGERNIERDMLQFRNSDTEPPAPNDLIVWGGTYGHVAVVAEVHDDYIVVVQQNIKGHPTASLVINKINGNYVVGGEHKPLGWLRVSR